MDTKDSDSVEKPPLKGSVKALTAAPLCRRAPKVPCIPQALTVRETLLPEAIQILELVNSRFGNGDNYLDHVFGRKITKSVANELIKEYLQREGLDGKIYVRWSSKLACSACMVPRGSKSTYSHTLSLNSTAENFYLREKAILALADHEIGTHYIRSHNEKLQLWSTERTKYHLTSVRGYKKLLTEEGLATLNTHLRLECKLLWKPALYYYAICMARSMDSSELHSHLEKYLTDSVLRDKVVYRAKRTLQGAKSSPKEENGCGWDQCYFVGAVKILRRLDKIDFTLLYSGKVSIEDLPRVKHIARTSISKLPHFLSGPSGVTSYSLTLHEIKRENAI